MFEYARRIKEWSRKLHAQGEWESALNTAFDRIGFTEAYLEDVKSGGRKSQRKRSKAIKDHVWGMIELDEDGLWLVDSPLMQRSRRVKQTGLTFLTYPTANHTRFDHSLGVYQVVTKLLAAARVNGPSDDQLSSAPSAITPDKCNEYHGRLLRHAALLHDMGHGPFSHVSEAAFMAEAGVFRIGPFTVDKFLKDFRLAMHGRGAVTLVDQVKATKLAELLSIAAITSKRFVAYYESRPGRTSNDNSALDDLCDISALILGVRISQNDLALPEILSGPVDADKIDYLMRDAKACGVSTSIDVARALLRAGVYQVNNDLLVKAKREVTGIDPNKPVRIFLIDPSGTDAVRELSDARGSLYRRVYHHQLTRNAEAHFRGMLRACRDSAELERFGDFLHLWAMPEDGLLHEIAQSGQYSSLAAQCADALRCRRLTRRAVCFHRKSFQVALPTALATMQSVGDATNQALDKIELAMPGLEGNAGFMAELEAECARIRDALLKSEQFDEDDIPTSPKPVGLQFLPYPEREDKTKSALLRRGDGIETYGQQLSGYEQAGSFQIEEKLGFLTAPSRWREIAAIAFQRVLFNRLEMMLEAQLTFEAAGDESSSVMDKEKNPHVLVGIRMRPILDLAVSAKACKLDLEQIRTMQAALDKACYFDFCPRAFAEPLDSVHVTVASRLADFNGQHGWRIDHKGESVAAFLSQFPPRLRHDCLTQVVSDIKVLTEDRVRVLITNAIDGLRRDDDRHFLFVPLSGSSGFDVRKALKGQIPANSSLYLNVSEALDKLRTMPDSVIVMIDDNLASGHQASKQLQVLFGKEEARPDSDQHRIVLSAEDHGLVLERGLKFALAVAHSDGMRTMIDTASALGLSGAAFAIERGEDILNFASRELSSELAAFLRKVGKGLAHDNLRRDGKITDAAELERTAEDRAMGYGNLSGLLVTPTNVPTSTITALWMPGTYVPEGNVADPNAQRLPWIPLLMRRDYWPYLVLP